MLKATRQGTAVLLLLAMAGCQGPGGDRQSEPPAELRFSVIEGRSANYFIRQDGISAHLNLQTEPRPRLVVAFPAGNSGALLLFKTTHAGPAWGVVKNLQTFTRDDDAGRKLHGLEAVIEVRAASLGLDRVDIGSIRFLRDAVDYATLPPRAPPALQVDGNTLRFTRERPDKQSSYLLELEALDGAWHSGDETRLVADADGRLTVRLAAASGDPLEPPVAASRLLANDVGRDEDLENALAFLGYETKLLAGSWRFLTYFGRDTLLTVHLLMPRLTADAAEIGIRSVLERLSEQGEVAHEEEIGELAVYRNLAERGAATAAPVYDYKMIDDNLMLAPVFERYVETHGRERAAQFLAGRTSSSQPLESQLARNFALVVRQARAFAAAPVADNLLSIRDGIDVGNWRDSQEGLVGGRYPYDVNAVLMPAALRAIADIRRTGLLGGDADALPPEDELRRMADTWEAHAAGYFLVTMDAEQARGWLAAYAAANAYPPADIPEAGMRFYAVALDRAFRPIPVMHSDVGTDLLFLERPEDQLCTIVGALARPFPAGLATPVGILAANPAFAGPAEQALVTRNHYHGTVAWSWQQAMIIAGLDRQLGRDDLPDALRAELATARDATWDAIAANRAIINSELWSFALEDGAYVVAPFGQSEGHLTESNAVQLWSTVFLALPPNQGDVRTAGSPSGRGTRGPAGRYRAARTP